MAMMFWILVKRQRNVASEPTRIIPFRLNRMQRALELGLALWNLLLKPRQTGGTTYFLLRRLFLPVIIEGGVGSLLISQSAEYASQHFQIVRRAYNLIGAANPIGSDEENKICISLKENLLHTVYANRRTLQFDYLDSKIMVATAEVEESGQGITLHHIVASEYARWPGRPEDTLSNVMGALVPGGTLDRESTGNGAAGPFYEACLRSMSGVKAEAKLHYFPHWYEDEYVDTTFTTLEGEEINLSKLTKKQIDTCIKDLEEEELAILALMQRDMLSVAWA